MSSRFLSKTSYPKQPHPPTWLISIQPMLLSLFSNLFPFFSVALGTHYRFVLRRHFVVSLMLFNESLVIDPEGLFLAFNYYADVELIWIAKWSIRSYRLWMRTVERLSQRAVYEIRMIQLWLIELCNALQLKRASMYSYEFIYIYFRRATLKPKAFEVELECWVKLLHSRMTSNDSGKVHELVKHKIVQK